MTEHETLIYGGMIFIGLMFLISKIGSKTNMPDKPKPQEPLTGNPQRAFQMQEEANFDSTAFQSARAIIADIERVPDAQTKTMVLADHLHRAEMHRQRTADRQHQQERKEYDMLDRVMQIADRFQGRQTRPASPPEPPRHNPSEWEPYREPRRINNYHNRGRLPDRQYFQDGEY